MKHSKRSLVLLHAKLQKILLSRPWEGWSCQSSFCCANGRPDDEKCDVGLVPNALLLVVDVRLDELVLLQQLDRVRLDGNVDDLEDGVLVQLPARSLEFLVGDDDREVDAEPLVVAFQLLLGDDDVAGVGMVGNRNDGVDQFVVAKDRFVEQRHDDGVARTRRPNNEG